MANSGPLPDGIGECLPVRESGLPVSANLAGSGGELNERGGISSGPADVPLGIPTGDRNISSGMAREDRHTRPFFRPSDSEPGDLSTSSGSMIIFVMVLMTMANIGCLCTFYRSADGFTSGQLLGRPLPNGDHMVRCPDRPTDETCFQMLDYKGKTLYRSEGRRRVLALYECDPSATETERFKCVGEYAFSHNSTAIWFHRLYLDRVTEKYSLISGPESRDKRVAYPRVRHMLSPPYNWIVSYDPIPGDDFPQSSLYVRGRVVVDTRVPAS